MTDTSCLIEFSMKIPLLVNVTETRVPQLQLLKDALDYNGNPVDAYYRTNSYRVHAELIYEDVSCDFREFNEEFQLKSKQEPFTKMVILFKGSTLDYYGHIEFTGVAYSISQFNKMTSFISSFLKDKFKNEVLAQ